MAYGFSTLGPRYRYHELDLELLAVVGIRRWTATAAAAVGMGAVRQAFRSPDQGWEGVHILLHALYVVGHAGDLHQP